ncbi:sugar phosphate isomerase/epimerase family protein [Xylophilus ampelinus]|uniref:Sugar phosphate isomerase/epimerase n=1 Tax=Xylophilus ampelinus TaxID=54067 RepID=A0A318SGE3_9BURK|nr:sugar phosphate isomerase/epimerase family protein [Xylophilus ampelinus]MCS4510901.1 sugar phosphate isomerase/epimerase [Xylophilus ampelinus]PYE76060.1 sugar phosphate isomerase/epimerase [Xylophilus ampelinus]
MVQALYRTDFDVVRHFPRISFSTNVYDNPADILGSIKSLGQHFDAVEFEVGEAAEKVFWSLSPAQRKELAQRISDYAQESGIELTVHAGWWGREYNLCSADMSERAVAIQKLADTVEFSRIAGATSVSFHPGYKDSHENAVLLENLIQALNATKAICDHENLHLCLENMGDQRPRYPIFSMAEHRRFHEQTGCHVTIDVTHLCSLFAYGPQLFSAIEAIAPITRHLHVADLDGMKHQHLPLGEGNLPLTDVLNRFAMSGYRGVAVVEEFIRSYATQFYLDRAIEYRKNIEDLIAQIH